MANRRSRTRAADILNEEASAVVDNAAERPISEMVGVETTKKSATIKCAHKC